MIKPKGTLIPIGGNEDKGAEENEQYNLDFIEEGILSHVVKESGGVEALIAVIPSASSIPVEVGQAYIDAFEKLGCKNIEVLDIRSREDAEREDYLEIANNADCIMFSGGDQSKITKRIGDTTLHELIADRYLNEEGFVVAGTSAGAMVMSQEMISGGSSTEAFFKGTVSMFHGLGLMPQIMFDTHFILRGRFGRVCEAVAKHPGLIGIGLAEDTGMVVKGGNEMKVIGSGMVIIFDGEHLAHNNEEILEEGTPMTMTNLKVHVLSNSDKFIVDERRVEVLPIEAPFE